MMRNILFLAIAMTYLQGIAQGITNDSTSINFFKFIYLRKSPEEFLTEESVKDANKGALLSFYNPKDQAPSFAINSALIFKILSSESSEEFRKRMFLLFLQYDRNNLIDEEQDNLRGGIRLSDNFLRKIKYSKQKRFLPETSLSLSFRKDFKNSFDAIQSNLLITPYFYNYFYNNKGTENEDDDDYYYSTSKNSPAGLLELKEDLIYLTYLVNLGVEYDYRFNGESVLLNGNLLRSFSQIKVNLEFWDAININADWQYRYNIWNTTGINKSEFSYFTANLNYTIKYKGFLTQKITPTIGVTYVNGEDPNIGFNEQSFYALNLSLKIN